ncbi:putative nucleotide kinase [Sphaerochaeta pleomorpha str. Grapes]|uniref:Putative nucleotide kinase n=1 Tax=Sphaerochaeta pleomorpha (strain ATCC BAA-1885 / DSM 22778 / Grapes) TaxID=158190 RepID=G8QXW8_SPHPG|nr:nucleoside-triphosphatase [Sphaerochaeta pleomorpha]AEV28473.1 putative nucleotide kinase [Sphaerochaeta pleomorpha str. Grapes]
MASKVIVITGDINGGKTTTLLSYLAKYRSSCLASEICGYISLANNEKTCYRLRDLSSGDERIALSEKELPSARRWGRFFVDDEVFFWANQTIEKHLGTANLVVFDELGRFELAGSGFDRAFRLALDTPDLVVLVTVRTQFLPQILQRYGLTDAMIELVRCQEWKSLHEEGTINCLE